MGRSTHKNLDTKGKSAFSAMILTLGGGRRQSAMSGFPSNTKRGYIFDGRETGMAFSPLRRRR
jgi:hypothetical protein